jgi:hypothetical protein
LFRISYQNVQNCDQKITNQANAEQEKQAEKAALKAIADAKANTVAPPKVAADPKNLGSIQAMGEAIRAAANANAAALVKTAANANAALVKAASETKAPPPTTPPPTTPPSTTPPPTTPPPTTPPPTTPQPTTPPPTDLISRLMEQKTLIIISIIVFCIILIFCIIGSSVLFFLSKS